MSKPIEFTIPYSDLCLIEDVKNFTILDGSRKTFIEKSAADALAEALRQCIEWDGKCCSIQVGEQCSCYEEHVEKIAQQALKSYYGGEEKL